MITDTQVLSYYYKGTLPLPKERPIQISSITASEFLLVHSKDHNRANYYPPLPAKLRLHGSAISKHIPLSRDYISPQHVIFSGKKRTDHLILDFGSSIPSYIEFGSLALSELINYGNEVLYMSGITHLDKQAQKKLQHRFRFLATVGTLCVVLTPAIAHIGLNLLDQFLQHYKSKENMRNTINDVLILGTAIKNETKLLTKDKLLHRFTAQNLGAEYVADDGRAVIDFSRPTNKLQRQNLESKSYINCGWKIIERRGR